ncbi:MAG TPA: hypothetical protein VI818_00145, partial [Candidatus Thermoplasmatota archaeon]|nr:hypothetical protein [Candidatus Thermoplasmatota archaeon]
LALSSKPVDTEIHLAKKPNLELRARLGDITAPMGPSLVPDRVRLAQNPSILPIVQRIHSDDHAKASTAIAELYRGGVATYRIEKLLSVGVLGQRNARKLVPTRWSITATDDQIGRQLIPKVQELSELDAVHYHEGVSHGNRFHVFLFPRPWTFDMIETWLKGAMWSLDDSAFIEDHEDGRGRTKYASNITGAYYAARLSVLEHLLTLRRQASAFVYREITPDYWAPLGVWLIREGVKRALASPAQVFHDTASAVTHAKAQTLRQGWDRASWLLGNEMRQKRLAEFA